MKITIENTTKVVEANGVQCRVWEGQTEAGVKIQALIPRIAVGPEDVAQFERELSEQRPPSSLVDAWPLRMIL